MDTLYSYEHDSAYDKVGTCGFSQLMLDRFRKPIVNCSVIPSHNTIHHYGFKGLCSIFFVLKYRYCLYQEPLPIL